MNTVNLCPCWELLQIGPDLAGHYGHHLSEGKAKEGEAGIYQACQVVVQISELVLAESCQDCC